MYVKVKFVCYCLSVVAVFSTYTSFFFLNCIFCVFLFAVDVVALFLTLLFTIHKEILNVN